MEVTVQSVGKSILAARAYFEKNNSNRFSLLN
jgi:hypothetical protein